MALIESIFPSMINGVSQQSPKVRLPSQGEEQLNAIADPVEGLRPRPGTRVKSILEDNEFDFETAAYHIMDRGKDTQHLLVVTDGDLKVYDLADGSQVTTTGSTSYLNLSGVYDSPRDAFRFLTVADYTFIVNREKTVATEPSQVLPALERRALVNIKKGDFGTTYKIKFKLNGVEFDAEFTTDNPITTSTSGSSEQNRDAIDTTTIVAGLVADLEAKLTTHYGSGPSSSLPTTEGFTKTTFNGPPQISYTVGGNWIAFESTTHDFQNFMVEDSQGDTAMTLSWKEAKKITDLPSTAPTAWFAKIGGQGDEVADDYYVRYDGSNWKEESYEPIRFITSTMPHALTWDGTDFDLNVIVWEDREAGDEDTNPAPSFVGQQLTDVFFFKDRLGFLAGENIVMSEVGEYFNFFRTTVLQVIDSDPIDVGVNDEKLSYLFGAITFDEKLMVFSSYTQFNVKGEPTLTPETVQADVATRFDMDPLVRPLGLGKSLYYVQPFGGLGKVREFYIDTDSENVDSADTTGHCPRYIQGNITHLAVSQAHDMVAVQTDDPAYQDSIWVYNFMWQGNEKVQSSWSRWNFPGFVVKWSGFIQSRFWLVVQHVESGEVLLEYMDISQTEDWSQNDIINKCHMDHYMRITSANPSDSYFTQSSEEGRFVFDEATFRFLSEDPTTSGTYHLGCYIPFLYTFSEFQLPSPSRGRDVMAVRLGMMMKTFTIHYTDTHSFLLSVSHKGRSESVKKITTKILNSELGVSDLPIRDGIFTGLIPGRPEHIKVTLKNNSIFPCAFQQAEWEAEAQSRARRL